MKLDPHTVSLISFFKNYDEYISFDSSLDPYKWDRVNIFYRWQLVKLNPEYKKFYKKVTSKPGHETLPKHANEIIFNSMAKLWNMSELLKPSTIHPGPDFHFIKSNWFNEVGCFSYQDLYDEEQFTDSADTLADLTAAKMTEIVFDPGQHPDDRRFMIIGIDLKTDFNKKVLLSLESKLKEEQTKYLELQKLNETNSHNYSESMLDMEKNIFVRRYSDKHGKLDGISKVFKYHYGSTSDHQRSSLRQRKERIDEYIENAKTITLNIATIKPLKSR